MTTPATTAMVEQMNRYFNAVKERLGTNRLLYETQFDETDGTSWTWDLKGYINNPSKYDFLTCRIDIFYSAGDGGYSPIGQEPSQVIFKYSITNTGILHVTKTGTLAGVNPPYRLYVYFPTKRYVPAPIKPEVTFDGEITGNQLISMQDLATLLGVTEGVPFNLDTNWLKFNVNETTLYVAKKPIRHSLSWDHLNGLNTVNGSREINIGANRYKVRLLGGVNSEATEVTPGYDTPPTHNSEWNELMYHIHSGVFTDPLNKITSEGITAGDLGSYSDGDLGVGYSINNHGWSIGTNFPIPISYHSSVELNGKIYICGGYLPQLQYQPNVYEYNPINGSAEIIMQGIARVRFGMTVHNNDIYCFGGQGSNVNKVLKFNPIDRTWFELIDMPYTIAGYQNTEAVTVDDKIYVVLNKKLYIYDVNLNVWSNQGVDIPNGRTEISLIANNNKIYILGGKTDSFTQPNSYLVYNISDGTWTSFSGPILPVSPKTTSINDKIYIYGGQTSTNPNNGYVKECWVLNTINGEFSLIPDAPTARTAHTLTSVESKFYVIGGITDNGLPTTNIDVFSSDNSSSIELMGTNSYCLNNLSGNIVGRGKYGISYVTVTPGNDLSETNGWRPVLELVSSDPRNIIFEGEITGSELISMSQLTTEAGVTQGSAMNLDTNWLKFLVDNNPIYVAKRPIRNNLSYNALETLGLTDGSKVLTIGQAQYRLRLLKSAIEDTITPESNGYNWGEMTGEFSDSNEVIYDVASDGIDIYCLVAADSQNNRLAKYDQVNNNLQFLQNATFAPGPGTLTKIDDWIYVVGESTSLDGSSSRVYRYNVNTLAKSLLANTPTQTSNSRIVSVNNTLYIFGGTTISGQPAGISLKYDNLSNNWIDLAPLPDPSYGFSTTVIGNKIYFFGGRAANHADGGQVYIYDTSNGTWEDLGYKFSGNDHLTTWEIDKYIYVLGGTNTYRSFMRFDTETNGLVRLEDFPYIDLNRPMAATLGNITYVFDQNKAYTFTPSLQNLTGYDLGYTHNSEWNELMYRIHSGTFTDPNNTMASVGSAASSEAQYTDSDLGLGYTTATLTNLVTTIPNVPQKRQRHAATVLNGKMVISGGDWYQEIGIHPTRLVLQYDPATNQWSDLPSDVAARVNHTLSNISGRLYAYGGVTNKDIPPVAPKEISEYTTDGGWIARGYEFNIHSHSSVGGPLNRIYSYGGILNNLPTNIFGVFGTSGIVYDNLSPGPYSSTYNHTAVNINDIMYVFGGIVNGEVSGEVQRYNFTTNQWMTDGTRAPIRVHSHVAGVINGKMYVYGGISGNGIPNPDLYSYDPLNDSWQLVATLPVVLYEATAVVIENKLYVYGGVTSSSQMNSDLYVISPEGTINFIPGSGNFTLPNVGTDKIVTRGLNGVSYSNSIDKSLTAEQYGWRPVLEYLGQTPTGEGWVTIEQSGPHVQGHTLTEYNGKLYVFGGFNIGTSQIYNTFYEFDPLLKTWQVIDSTGIEPRYHHTATVINNKLYLYGGVTSDYPTYTETIDCYNFITGEWEVAIQSSLKPLPRAFHVAGNLSDKLVIYGGRTDVGVNGDTWVYDPTNGQWEQMLPHLAVEDTTSTVHNNKLYVCGGITPTGTPISTISIYDLDASWAFGGNQGNLGRAPNMDFVNGLCYINIPNSLFIYNPLTSEVTSEPTSVNTNTYSSSCVIGNSIYVYGGYRSGGELGTITTNQMLKYTP